MQEFAGRLELLLARDVVVDLLQRLTQFGHEFLLLGSKRTFDPRLALRRLARAGLGAPDLHPADLEQQLSDLFLLLRVVDVDDETRRGRTKL